ncbi:MAG TPA: NADH-quinone oxidoreductase subunit N, partial [Phycisphaerae bacterium]|nr:NADH-quinone oxidoreductase subunit N [Phycisphaerae bacterium]
MLALLGGNLWMPSLDDLAMLGPLWSLAGTIVAVLLAALVVGRNWRVSGLLAIAGGAVTAILAGRSAAQLDGNWAGFAHAGGPPMLVLDQFSMFFMLLLGVFVTAICGMWCLGQHAARADLVARRSDAAEFFVLLFGSAFGMALMVCTTNLLMIILAVETASLPSYALVGFHKKHRPAAEASMKYVLFGAVTSAVMIYGVSLLYGQYHTLDLVQIGHDVALQVAGGAGPTVLTGVSLFALMVGVCFKVSAVPFHFWCPDVFEGASIEVTTWLSVASKAAGLGLLLRIVCVMTATVNSATAVAWVAFAVAIMAAVTCTVGNLSAYWQTNLKRLLAFSSIAHAGYMLMAVAIIWRPVGPLTGMAHPAFSAVVAYLSVYMLMNLGAFGVVAAVYWATGKETIDAFNGLARRNPLLAVVMGTCLFSLVGLPFFGGFMVKWYLLVALYQGGLLWLVIVAVLNTLLSLYYYARIASAMCFVDDNQPAVRAPVLGGAVLTFCALL